MAEVEVLSTERIPEQPLVREVLLFAPSEDEVPESPPAHVTGTVDDEMMLPGYDSGSSFAESLRALRASVLVGQVRGAYTSSLLNPAETCLQDRAVPDSRHSRSLQSAESATLMSRS